MWAAAKLGPMLRISRGSVREALTLDLPESVFTSGAWKQAFSEGSPSHPDGAGLQNVLGTSSVEDGRGREAGSLPKEGSQPHGVQDLAVKDSHMTKAVAAQDGGACSSARARRPVLSAATVTTQGSSLSQKRTVLKERLRWLHEDVGEDWN